MIRARFQPRYQLVACSLATILSACGGGGGGGTTGNPSSTGNSTGANGAALLAAYSAPADIAADVVTNYTGPAYSVGNSGLTSNCSSASLVSTTVVDAPDVVVFAASGASVKAQELAADLFENQAVPQIRNALDLSTTGTAFDGSNKVQLCVDTALGGSSGESGASITGQTGQGTTGPVIQIMSADSANFDARYPNATSYTSPTGQSYASLLTHEGTHAALYSLAEPFGGMETWFQEGMATTVAQQPIGTKASVLALVQGADLLAITNTNANLNAYPAYEATVGYLTSSATGGLGYGLTNIKTFVAAYRAAAVALCVQTIPSGLTPNANETAGMASGMYNVCAASTPGMVDARLETAFDQAFNATFKNTDGSALLLHTADGANSLEATLYSRLSSYLP